MNARYSTPIPHQFSIGAAPTHPPQPVAVPRGTAARRCPPKACLAGCFSLTASLFLLFAVLVPASVLAQSAPPNDLFVNRTSITGLVATVTGSNVGATKETGEPNHAGNPGGGSVWWKWIVPTNGLLTIDTIGSSFDTLLAVYTGSSVTSLSLIASSDDRSAGDYASQLTLSVSPSGTFQIAVDGFAAARGDIVLNVRLGPRPPQITNQPQSQVSVLGATVPFIVGASGEPPLTYQWLKDQVGIPDATNAVLNISNAQTNDDGAYSVIVSNVLGGAISSIANLTIGAVVITDHPQSMTVAAGYPVTFGVTASGTHAITYQWWKDDLLLGATNASYTITNVQYGDAGAYRVVVVSDLGSVTSSNAVLTVITPYTFATFAGQPGNVGTNDGTGSTAQFNYPHGLALDGVGNLYVTEVGNEAIRKITPEGMVSTITRLRGVQTNYSPYNGPWGVAVDGASNVYVSDTGNGTILRINPDGQVVTLAGHPGGVGFVDGTNSAAHFSYPSGLLADSSGHIFVADWNNNRIRKLTQVGTNWVVTTVAGRGNSGFVDGKAAKASFFLPTGLSLDTGGSINIVDELNCALRRLSSDGQVTTLAGGVPSGYADGSGRRARFSQPHGGGLDSAGNIYIADLGNNVVRRVTPDGVVTTLAGWPKSNGSNDGTGGAARFGQVRWVVADSIGDLYVSDYDNHTIRKGVPFTITTWPQSQAVLLGTSVSLSVAANGPNGPFSYQWSFLGVPLAGQTGTTLDLGPVTRTNSGPYSVRVSNGVGNWITLNATVRALVPPIIQTPQVLLSGNVRLSFQDADGGLPYDLNGVQAQWRSNLPSGTDTNWLPLVADPFVTNGLMIFIDTNVFGSSRFYRILEQ